ncbi:MAG: hypothetical protein ACP59X_09215 [Solidesulfovibrio sp. DCME]|uniref:hypothetical protein n=1 Tax=Solidesulfovibrio sp. DCME TaxID=3447380 RepID=UPI003D0A669A
MSEGPVRTCPACGQALRFPGEIGGMLMACPVCGHRFASPFRLAGPASLACDAAGPAAGPAPEETARPAAQDPAALRPLRQTSLAARVAALYAAKSR